VGLAPKIPAVNFWSSAQANSFHVNIGVEFGGIEGERGAGNSALLVHHRLETSQVERAKHLTVLVCRYVALKLEVLDLPACILVASDKPRTPRLEMLELR